MVQANPQLGEHSVKSSIGFLNPTCIPDSSNVLALLSKHFQGLEGPQSVDYRAMNADTTLAATIRINAENARRVQISFAPSVHFASVLVSNAGQRPLSHVPPVDSSPVSRQPLCHPDGPPVATLQIVNIETGLAGLCFSETKAGRCEMCAGTSAGGACFKWIPFNSCCILSGVCLQLGLNFLQ